MTEITLDDLRVPNGDPATVGGMIQTRKLTPAEFDRIATERGYVKRPACEPCMGTGGTRVPCMRCKNGESEHSHQCPSCDGTGFGRLVALPEINWDIMRRCYDVLSDFAAPWESEHFKKVLAAIDQEDTNAD